MTNNEITLERVRQLLSLEVGTGVLSWRSGTSVRARGEAGYINAHGYQRPGAASVPRRFSVP